ncbi:MAG: DNA repair protein RadC [Bacteroidales bacterium]|nr:DNA repair protein RadC [Bacteroidales bacterium]
MKNLNIKNWASDDRPREKLLGKGAQNLSDAEILGILLGSGTPGQSAVELGRKVLSMAENHLGLLGKMNVNELIRIKGIGMAKAVNIVAAMELARRVGGVSLPEKAPIRSSTDAYHGICSVLCDLPHEEFWVIYLNKANRIIETYKCSQGGIAGTVIDIRLILRRGIEVLASSLIIAHNHPSGNEQPSESDKGITKKLSQAADQMDIKLLDHLIIAGRKYFSFADEGLL